MTIQLSTQKPESTLGQVWDDFDLIYTPYQALDIWNIERGNQISSCIYAWNHATLASCGAAKPIGFSSLSWALGYLKMRRQETAPKSATIWGNSNLYCEFKSLLSFFVTRTTTELKNSPVNIRWTRICFFNRSFVVRVDRKFLDLAFSELGKLKGITKVHEQWTG